MNATLEAPAGNGGGRQQLSRVDQIENRINRDVVTSISVSANRGMAVDSMGQALEVAKLMSVSGHAVPNHLRGNPGACLAVAIQGWEWGINPFAIANKSYVVNDRLAYESALYHAVLSRRAPIKGRVKMDYEGDAQNRTCRVWAELADGSGIVEYTSPKFVTINPKNSPLWKNDPDQQLFYFSVRSFARRHFPDVMMGISTVDELQDVAVSVVEPPKNRTAALLEKITSRPVDEGQTFEPTPDAIDQATTGDDSTVSPPHSEDSPGATPVTDARPSSDNQASDASPAGPAEAPASPEPETRGMSDDEKAQAAYVEWVEQCQAIGDEVGMPRPELAKALHGLLAAKGLQETPTKLAADVRARTLEQIRTRTGLFAPAKTRKA